MTAKNPPRATRTIRRAALAAALVITGLLPGNVQAQVQTYTCTAAGGFGEGVAPIPAAALTSLKTVPNPVIPKDPATGAPLLRDDLKAYVANLNAAIQLGKALFWDMQAGSDNKTACATCHFQAGADVRDRNQLHPGPNGAWDTGYAANYAFNLDGSDFPFPIQLNTDKIAGSQGVRKSTFQSIGRGGAETTTTPTGFRQVTGMNTPPAVNAVFNHRQFWNGRAQPEFNGVNPWGRRDTSARVWVLNYKGVPGPISVSIPSASLASQAVGPALNDVEMSATNRTFPDLGKKMLSVKPLGLQKVDPNDSVLGPLADTTKGLKTTYTALIQQAFQPKWWNYSKTLSINGKSYKLMEANFSLFWGLAIMLYEATLVSDDSPMDQFLEGRVIDPTTGALVTESGLETALDAVVNRLWLEDRITITRQDILDGLALFEKPVRLAPSFPAVTGVDGVGCIGCHLGAELTGASMRNLTGHGLEPGAVVLTNAGFDVRMERMFMKLDWTPPGPLSLVPAGANTIDFYPGTYSVNVTNLLGTGPVTIPLPVATYDAGWYNVGVRPTAEDLGLGGQDPFGKYLSWTQYFQQTLSDPSSIKVPGNGLPCVGAGNAAFPDELLNLQGFPLLSGPLTKTENTDVPGAFKVPNLRNVELNGPYLHNGGKSTLMQVVEFYDDSGDFANATKAPTIVPLLMDPEQRKALVAFLLSLTDERVRFERKPFDHPQLLLPNGGDTADGDNLLELPAVGASGRPAASPLQRFLNLNPFLP